MGYKVKLEDEVRFDGRRISPEPVTYVILNKPKGVATTNSKSKGLTVMDIVANSTNAKIKPFGRLGRNATGLLLFTNDDSFRQKFTKKGMDRLFHIELDKNLKATDLQKIVETAAAATSGWIYAQMEYQNQKALQELRKKSNVEVLKFPAAVLAELRQLTEATLMDEAEANPEFRRVYEAYTAFSESYSDWSAMSDEAYLLSKMK